MVHVLGIQGRVMILEKFDGEPTAMAKAEADLRNIPCQEDCLLQVPSKGA